MLLQLLIVGGLLIETAITRDTLFEPGGVADTLYGPNVRPYLAKGFGRPYTGHSALLRVLESSIIRLCHGISPAFDEDDRPQIVVRPFQGVTATVDRFCFDSLACTLRKAVCSLRWWYMFPDVSPMALSCTVKNTFPPRGRTNAASFKQNFSVLRGPWCHLCRSALLSGLWSTESCLDAPSEANTALLRNAVFAMSASSIKFIVVDSLKPNRVLAMIVLLGLLFTSLTALF